MSKLGLILLILSLVSSGAFAQGDYLHSCEYSDRQTPVQALSCTLFFEAGNANEGVAGLYAVAFTTLNRVQSKRFPDTVAGVVYQPFQYSWAMDGKSDRVPNTYYDKIYWEKCLHIAEIALSIKEEDYTFYDITEGALFYHSIKIYPYWADEGFMTVRINGHTFYNNDKKK